jgi:hypothetical protein
MRRDIFFFAAGAVMTGLAAEFGTDTTLWNIVIAAGILVMAFTALDALFRVISDREKPVLPLIGMIVFGVAFLGCLGWYLWPRKPVPSPASLPLTITELREPGYDRYSGLWPGFGAVGSSGEKAAKLDPPYLGIGDVYISNTSLNRSVTLRISLIIRDENGATVTLNADGIGPFGAVIGRDDYVTKALERDGRQPNKYILSPVSISPQTTIHGSLPFIIPFGFGDKVDGDILDYYSSGVLIPAKRFRFTLEINDVVSGVTITIPVPSKGYSG